MVGVLVVGAAVEAVDGDEVMGFEVGSFVSEEVVELLQMAGYSELPELATQYPAPPV